MSSTVAKVMWTLATYAEAQRAIRRQSDSERIRKTQNARLQALLRHCADNVKYYKERFHQAGVDVGQIRTAEDLHRLPFLSKEELRTRFWDFLPRALPACRVSRTSGSTGIPVCIFADWTSRKRNSAAVIRFRKAVGIPLIGRPLLTLLNTDKDPPKPPQWTFLQGVHRQYFLNPYVNAPENIEYARELAAKLKKPILTGIASSVRTLAHQIRDRAFPALKPELVTTGGEMLMPQVRKLIETTFDTPVVDVYACNEARDVAWQCRHTQGYHINADNVIVEIVNGDKPAAVGEVGEVVLTDLNRYVMPIVRYKNGDLAKLAGGPCPCGCKLPMIAEITGRTGQNIRLPDGRTVLWNHLKGLMNHPDVRQFRLVQERDGHFTVSYVPEKQANIETLDNLLLYRFRTLIGDSIRITLEKTSSLAPSASGKSELVVSHYDPRRNKRPSIETTSREA